MLQGSRNKILCVGRIYCDLIFTGAPNLPVLGQEIFADGLQMHAGGGCFITAAYLSALGNQVAVAAMLPAEPFTKIIIDEIHRLNLDDNFCCPAPPDLEPQITVAVVHDNERAFLTRRAGPAMPSDADACFAMPDLTHLHIGELATLIEHPDLIDKARAADLTISLDCGWDEATFNHSGLSELISNVDVFLPNASEANRLSENAVSLNCAPLTIVKRGAEGAELYSHRQRYVSPACDVPVIDTTGAGDAFNAGFVTSWLQNKSPEACLAAGNYAGSIAVGRVGGAAGLSPGVFQDAPMSMVIDTPTTL